MALSELAAWAALGLVIILGALFTMQTVRLRRVEKQFRALTKGVGPGAAALSLAELVSRQGERLEMTRNEVDAIRRAVSALDSLVTASVQRIGLVRYNPFQDTGGDQSFALALLDKRGDGVVISSLHGRTNTRFYAKLVKEGASQLSLSDEERQALAQALESTEGVKAGIR